MSVVADVLKIAATQKESYAASKGSGAFMTEQERDGAAQRLRDSALKVAASHLETVRGALVGSLGCGEEEIDARIAGLEARAKEADKYAREQEARAEKAEGIARQQKARADGAEENARQQKARADVWCANTPRSPSMPTPRSPSMQHLQRTLSMIYSLYMSFLAVHSPSLHHTSTFTFLASHFIHRMYIIARGGG